MPSCSPLLTDYLNRLVLGGYRPRTVEARSQCLRAFAASIEPRGLAAATRQDAESYLSRPLSAESRRAYRSHLRSFYAWAVDEGHVQTSPLDKVPAIRVKRGVPRPLSEEQFSAALEQAGPRMRAWLLLMALGGLRCLEVAALRPQDVLELEGATVLHLRECKGGGQGTVPAHPLVLEALAALPVRGRAWWTVTPRTVSQLVNAHLRDCGIAATAHALRHLAATNWYRVSGHDLLATAVLLRHASVESTQGYARINPARSQEIAGAVRLRVV